MLDLKRLTALQFLRHNTLATVEEIRQCFVTFLHIFGSLDGLADFIFTLKPDLTGETPVQTRLEV